VEVVVGVEGVTEKAWETPTEIVTMRAARNFMMEWRYA
jgi:hypothetical protein